MPFYQGKKEFGEKFIGEPTTWTTQVTRIAREGDVLMSVRAPVGPVNFATREICIGRGLAAIRPRTQLDRDFLFYFLLHKRDEIEGTEGAVFASISKTQIEAISIAAPDLPEQQRIVTILDKAFAAIATAKANTEKNLANAHALFESHLQAVFCQPNKIQETESIVQHSLQGGNDSKLHLHEELSKLNDGCVTKTGGREATLRHITGELSLAVGMPSKGSKKGWQWSSLSDLAQLESGHTPSRKHPEYWGGSIPWIGIQDAREHHGRVIADTNQKTNALGIANSSARVLPRGTVCLSRTASVGYVVVMAQPMATSQDFVNWICSGKLQPDFLKYLFLAEGREGLLRYASGSVHQTIYFPEAKAFHICYPEIAEQNRIVRQCDTLRDETQRLEALYQQKLAALEALKKSLLHQAFTGQLTRKQADTALETV
jgi:restriction endonuclease S subunit